jgi:hypothetical protein
MLDTLTQCTSLMNSRCSELISVIFAYNFHGDDATRQAFENLLCSLITSNAAVLDTGLMYLVRLLKPGKAAGIQRTIPQHLMVGMRCNTISSPSDPIRSD